MIIMDRECYNEYNQWCFTASKRSARKKLSRAKSKAHRAKEKLLIKNYQKEDE